MARKDVLCVILIVALLGIIAYLYLYGLLQVSQNKNVYSETVKGVIVGIDGVKKEMYISVPQNGKRAFFIGEETELSDQSGNPIDFSYLRKGFSVSVTSAPYGRNFAKKMKVTKEPGIIVYLPAPGDEIGLPLEIEGVARVFENTFSYRILDKDATILMENYAMAESPDIGIYGPFKIDTYYSQPKSAYGTIEVFEYSAKDGSEINKVAIPVVFKDVESMNVKVFFGNIKLNPASSNCSKVFPVERRVPKMEAVGMAALAELLKGANNIESNEGYFSSINSGVTVRSLNIVGGMARADFDKALEANVGGSCRVAAIRSEITETLKQFPSIKNVIISIEGRTDDILQP